MSEAAMKMDVHSWGIGREKKILKFWISILTRSFAVEETYLIWKVIQLAILPLLILKAAADNSNVVRNTSLTVGVEKTAMQE